MEGSSKALLRARLSDSSASGWSNRFLLGLRLPLDWVVVLVRFPGLLPRLRLLLRRESAGDDRVLAVVAMEGDNLQVSSSFLRTHLLLRWLHLHERSL